MTDYKFNLQDAVSLKISGESGYVIGRSEQLDADPQYLVRYKAGDGRATEAWWASSALTLERSMTAGVDVQVDQIAVETSPVMSALVGLTAAQIGVELDADGIPWDESVHASTKNKNADGRWKKRRNVTEAQAAAAVAPAQAALAATPLPTPQPAVALPVATAPVSYDDLVREYTNMAATGFLTAEDMALIYATVGTNLQDLGTNESARRAVVDQMKAVYTARTSPAGLMPGLPG